MTKEDKGKEASPVLSKERFEERLKQLEQEKETVKTTLIAYDGAIQDCKYWIEQLK